MKRKIVLIFLVLIMVFQLSSCGNTISVSDAKEMTIDFLEAIEAEDHEKAKELLHPDVKKDEDAIEDFVKHLKDKEIVLKGEVKDIKANSRSISVYTSEYQGASCEIAGTIKVGEVTYNYKCLVVNNKTGHGIYSFIIDKE